MVIILPKQYSKDLKLRRGDNIKVTREKGKIVIEKQKKKIKKTA
jgi:antitoxin component of MazEF toxin-antitoxin module